MFFIMVPPRRGWPMVAAVALTQALALATWRTWVGSWSQTLAALGNVLVFTGPVAAGVSAWIVRKEQAGSARLMLMSSSRREHVPVLRLGTECFVWATIGCVLGSGGPILWTAREAVFSHPPFWPWIPIAATLFAACLVGVAVAIRLQAQYSAAVVSVGLYALIVGALYVSEEALASLTPADPRFVFLFVIPAWVYLLQGAWLVLAAMAVAIRAANVSRLAGVVAVVAGVLAAPLLLRGHDDRYPDRNAMEFECFSQPAADLCLPRAKAHMSSEIQAAIGEFWTLAGGLIEDDTTLIDNEAEGLPGYSDLVAPLVGRYPGQVILFSELSDISAVSHLDREQFLGDLVGAFTGQQKLDPRGSDPSTGPSPARPSEVVARWLFEQLGLPLDGSGWPGAPILDERVVDYSDGEVHLRWLTSLSQERRHEWFRLNRREILNGTLSFESFD